MIKDLYHCTPNEIKDISERELRMHFEMLMEERKQSVIDKKREDQKLKLNKK